MTRFRQIVGGLDLDHQPLVNDHVDSLEANHFSLVMDLNPNFSSNSASALRQFPGQGLGVEILEKTISKLVVHIIRRPNDRRCEVTIDQLDPARWLPILRPRRSVGSAGSASSLFFGSWRNTACSDLIYIPVGYVSGASPSTRTGMCSGSRARVSSM